MIDIILIIIIIALVTLAIYSMVKDKNDLKKSGGCGCGCSSCAMAGQCKNYTQNK